MAVAVVPGELRLAAAVGIDEDRHRNGVGDLELGDDGLQAAHRGVDEQHVVVLGGHHAREAEGHRRAIELAFDRPVLDPAGAWAQLRHQPVVRAPPRPGDQGAEPIGDHDRVAHGDEAVDLRDPGWARTREDHEFGALGRLGYHGDEAVLVALERVVADRHALRVDAERKIESGDDLVDVAAPVDDRTLGPRREVDGGILHHGRLRGDEAPHELDLGGDPVIGEIVAARSRR